MSRINWARTSRMNWVYDNMGGSKVYEPIMGTLAGYTALVEADGTVIIETPAPGGGLVAYIRGVWLATTTFSFAGFWANAESGDLTNYYTGGSFAQVGDTTVITLGSALTPLTEVQVYYFYDLETPTIKGEAVNNFPCPRKAYRAATDFTYDYAVDRMFDLMGILHAAHNARGYDYTQFWTFLWNKYVEHAASLTNPLFDDDFERTLVGAGRYALYNNSTQGQAGFDNFEIQLYPGDDENPVTGLIEPRALRVVLPSFAASTHGAWWGYGLNWDLSQTAFSMIDTLTFKLRTAKNACSIQNLYRYGFAGGNADLIVQDRGGGAGSSWIWVDIVGSGALGVATFSWTQDGVVKATGLTTGGINNPSHLFDNVYIWWEVTGTPNFVAGDGWGFQTLDAFVYPQRLLAVLNNSLVSDLTPWTEEHSFYHALPDNYEVLTEVILPFDQFWRRDNIVYDGDRRKGSGWGNWYSTPGPLDCLIVVTERELLQTISEEIFYTQLRIELVAGSASAWGAWTGLNTSDVDSTGHTGINFAIYPEITGTGTIVITIKVKDANGTYFPYNFTVTKNQWNRCTVSFATLGAVVHPVAVVDIGQASSPTANAIFFITDIKLDDHIKFQSEERCINPGFEDPNGGEWVNWNSHATIDFQSTEQAQAGTKSCKVTVPASQVTTEGVGQQFASIINQLVKIEAWVYHVSGCAPCLAVWDNTSGIETDFTPSSEVGAWQKLTAFFTPGATGFWVAVVGSVIGEASVFYVDTASIKVTNANLRTAEFKYEENFLALDPPAYWFDDISLNLEADDPYPWAPRVALSLGPDGLNPYRGPSLVHYAAPIAPWLMELDTETNTYVNMHADAQTAFYAAYGGTQGPIKPVHTRNDIENIALLGCENFNSFSWWPAYPEATSGLGQYWAFMRLAHYYFVSRDATAWTILDHWLTWINANGAADGSSWKFPVTFDNDGSFHYGTYDPGQTAAIAIGCLYCYMANQDSRANTWARRILDDLRIYRQSATYNYLYKSDLHYGWLNALVAHAFGLAINGRSGQTFTFASITEDLTHFSAMVSQFFTMSGDSKSNVLNADLLPFSLVEAADNWAYAPNYMMNKEFGSTEALVLMMNVAFDYALLESTWTWFDTLLDFLIFDNMTVLPASSIEVINASLEKSMVANKVRIIFGDFMRDKAYYVEKEDTDLIAAQGEMPLEIDLRYGNPIITESINTATLIAERALAYFSKPIEQIEIETWLEGLRIIPGETVNPISPFNEYTDDQFFVISKLIDLKKKRVKINAIRQIEWKT